MTDRLRRIDALVAERVLGCKPKPGYRGGYDCGCETEPYHYSLDFVIGGDPFHDKGNLAEYTRSLDASIEAALSVLTADHPILLLRYDLTENKAQRWWVQVTDACEDFIVGDCYCDHPAEALCLAMLRARGVTEEEINER